MNKRVKEAIVICLILIALISSYFYLKPAITGYLIVSKEFNYSDKVSLAFNESSSYVWQLANYGELKSIRLNGRIEDKGFAKVYVEDDGIRYLIFDSAKLKEKGIVDITALAILNETILNQTIVNETINTTQLNQTINKTKINETFNKTESLNQTIINKTLPLNQTINETIINKTITINLEYKKGTDYDIDDNGIETTTGVVDLTVENTFFNWDVDEEKLCTKWETYSIEEEKATTVCYGSEKCCNFVELSSSSDNWNDVFYSYYGLYGATANNVISAQVIYFDLTADELFAEVYYSNWDNLSAKFYYETVLFSNICDETCFVSGFNKTNYTLIIEVSNTTLVIDSVDYVVKEEIEINNVPNLIENISDIIINKNKNYTINLSKYFYDEDGDLLSYSAYETDNLSIVIEDGIATIIPDKEFVGVRHMFFKANDSKLIAVSNVFSINVLAAEFVIRNSLEEKIASVDQDGNMFVDGIVENQSALIPTNNSFIIKNKAEVIAYVNSSGYLFLKGGLFENALMEANGNNFEIRVIDELVAFFDAQGNLRLKGELFENYEE